jgi:Mce-associated membrane protein
VANKDVKVTEAAEGTAPAEDTAPAEGTAPAGETTPAEGTAPARESTPAEDTAPAEESAPAEEGAAAKEPSPDRRRSLRIAAALGAATVVLGGFGVWATVHASSERSSAAAQNTALTDGPATAAVRREIAAAVNTIFSYNYANTAATRRAAQGLLTGPAVRQYNTLFALVTKNAPAQKLVVTTRVTNTGVEMLNGDRARLLVFANQQDTRAGTSQTSYAGAMFAVTALREGGRWKIENIDTFSR